MKVKNFYLNLEGDKIPLLSLGIEEDGSIVEGYADKDYVLSNNPQILDITHLNYLPAKKSFWNGSEFIAPEGEEHRLPCGDLCADGCTSFAFLKDNIYYGLNGYCIGVGNNNMLIAALSSNPTITFEIV
jgi:hypothetical protein